MQELVLVGPQDVISLVSLPQRITPPSQAILQSNTRFNIALYVWARFPDQCCGMTYTATESLRKRILTPQPMVAEDRPIKRHVR
jgi:hypothetical protein